MGEVEGPLVESTQEDDQVCTFESGELWAEDVRQGRAIIPEVDLSPTSINLEAIQITDSDGNTPDEVDRLRQIIWRRQHILMGKGNALSPSAQGAICDIDVGSARLIAQRVRKVAPQFKKKLADLIKGLLSAKIIQPSTSPDLNHLMVYPMPLINELLEDMHGALWAGTEETKDLFAMVMPDVKWGPSVEWSLDVCDNWNLSISAVKSSWGCRKLGYLGHRISDQGLEAHPKDLHSLVNLPLPSTLKAMQSFLGSLNNYLRFIEDYAVYASILYELREVEFHAWRCKLRTGDGVVAKKEDEEKWSRAQVAFAMLKNKIVSAPILRHFDPSKEAVVIVYASEWAISASFVQDHGHSTPQGPDEAFYIGVASQVYGVTGTSRMTPRKSVDSILSSIAPKKYVRQVVDLPTPTVGRDKELYVMSYDGSALVNQGGGACSATVWKLTNWTIVKAASKFLVTSTVNEAVYEGMLLGFDLLEPIERRRMINLWRFQLGGTMNAGRDRSADQLASTALRQKEAIKLILEGEWPNCFLETINRLPELLVPKDQSTSAKVLAVTRSRASIKMSGEIRQEGVIQRLRTDRIREGQEQEDCVQDLKAYLRGYWVDLSMESARSCSKMARDCEMSDI
ncbi:unnamed protein product [Peronospora belbahrii]|nr:unnamed protein product [Peronospora belbahrii]